MTHSKIRHYIRCTNTYSVPRLLLNASTTTRDWTLEKKFFADPQKSPVLKFPDPPVQPQIIATLLSLIMVQRSRRAKTDVCNMSFSNRVNCIARLQRAS